MHFRNLKQALNQRLRLKSVRIIIKLNEIAWLKLYIDMNTDLRINQKMILKKILLSWWIMLFLEKVWKRWENIEISNLSQQKEEKIICC